MQKLFFILTLTLSVDAYGGYGNQSPAFRLRADFEPKAKTISPVLPVGENAYYPPPPIPMPEKPASAVEVVSSSESKEGCDPENTISTTTPKPTQGCGSALTNEHVHVDEDSGIPLNKILPPQVGYDESKEVSTPASEIPSQSGGGSYSSATKEEIDLYGIDTGEPASPSTLPSTTPEEVTSPVAPSSTEVSPATSTNAYESTNIATSVTTASSSPEAAAAFSYGEPTPPAIVETTTLSHNDKPGISPFPSSAAPSSSSYNPGLIKIKLPMVPSASKNSYDSSETPAEQIAHIPNNENLYEKIGQLPDTSQTTSQSSSVATPEVTVPYDSSTTGAPYQPPAPHAQLPSKSSSSNYQLINEVEEPSDSSYGHKVEASHLTKENTEAEDYDDAGWPQQVSSQPGPTSISKSSSQSGDGYDFNSLSANNRQTSTGTGVKPAAQAYEFENPVQASNNFPQSYNQQKPYGQVNSFGNTGYAVSQQQAVVPTSNYVQPPRPYSVSIQPNPYLVGNGGATQQANGCCAGSWFSQQGSLCAPVNYNPCPAPSYSVPAGCGQSFNGFGASSCGGGCQSSCASPCPAPAASGCSNRCAPACPPPCPPQIQQCCCPQPVANPFASLCAGRKKRSIQTLLGLCGRVL